MNRRLLEALATDGDNLRAAASAFGGHIRFDPREALSRDAAMGLKPPTLWSPNRHCRLVETRDGWIAVNLAREDDRRTVPAWVGCAPDTDIWKGLIAAAKARNADDLLAGAIELHLPVSRVGEVTAQKPFLLSAKRRDHARRPAALDLSALWAGPYCGALLAEAGIEVTRIESAGRPDPTPQTAPMLDHRLNGRKKRLVLDFADRQIERSVAETDILITSARPHALARLGFTEDRLFAVNPGLIWVAITAHGWRNAAGMRVGFGDDCAAAGGLLSWRDDRPRFLGDALADPLTGIAAATNALRMLAQGTAGLIDVALAPTAAQMAARLGPAD